MVVEIALRNPIEIQMKGNTFGGGIHSGRRRSTLASFSLDTDGRRAFNTENVLERIHRTEEQRHMNDVTRLKGKKTFECVLCVERLDLTLWRLEAPVEQCATRRVLSLMRSEFLLLLLSLRPQRIVNKRDVQLAPKKSPNEVSTLLSTTAKHPSVNLKSHQAKVQTTSKLAHDARDHQAKE